MWDGSHSDLGMPEPMLINDIYQWARVQPHKIAVIHEDNAMDYATFARAIEVTRLFLERQQLPRGKAAVIVAFNVLDGWIIDIAFRPIGMNTAAVHSIKHAEDLKIRDVACVVTTELEAKQHAFDGRAFAGAKIVAIPMAIYASIGQGDVPTPLVSNAPAGGQILCTSGTMGSFKKLMHEGKYEDARVAARARTHGFDQRTIHHQAYLPLWSGAGNKRSSAIWHVGGTVVMDQRKALGERFFDHSPNRCILTPPVFNVLMASQPEHNPRLNCKIEVGGGLPQANIAKKALQICNEASVEYSASELGVVPLYCDINSEQNVFWFSAANDRTIEIVDESLAECSPGREGTLRIKLCEFDCTYYLDDPDATSKAFRDGYFYTGDLAVKRADGRIRILGRVADTINLQGQKVAVAPIEQRLQDYLQVEEVCLFAHLTDQGQDELIVAIQSHSMPSQAKLDQIRREFHSFEKIRFPVLQAFPRAETGFQKVSRIALRDLVANEKLIGE
jgi:acyl-coenzyme A synthetase/AMP-(fatty) acid ligase